MIRMKNLKKDTEEAGRKETALGDMHAVRKIIFGNFLITVAYAFLTVPNHIVNGGVTSFAMVLENYLPFTISTISNTFVLILLFVSFLFLGKTFLIKSLLSSICYMGFFSVFTAVSGWIPYTVPIPAAVIAASVMVGIGYYLCLSAGASTVGFDVLALIAHKKNPKVNVALTMRYINYGVLFLGILAYGIWAVVIGVVFTYLQTAVLGLFFKRDERKVAKRMTKYRKSSCAR